MNDVQLKKLLWVVFISILSLFFLFYGISRIKKHKKEKPKTEVKNDNKTESVKYHWVVEDRIPVSFTGEYGETVYISKGRGFSFENSPEPYCTENLTGSEACGQKGEDISSKLPKDSNYNTGLKFKSSNGKSGQLIIVVWISVKN